MAVELEIKNLFFRYTGIGASNDWVLQNISLTFTKIECAAIVGASGSGKTTLIQHFTGLLRPTSGQVLVDGQNIWDKRFDQNRLRRRIGLVFQFPETQLFEETVFRDVAFGPRNYGCNAEQLPQIVETALREVGLSPEQFLERSPFHLSEGEKRRVAIAGILAIKPEVIVFDEPTAGLDAAGVEEMERIIEKLVSNGTAVIIVTHHMDFVNDIAQRVIVMKEGHIAYDGGPDRLFADERLLSQAGLMRPQFLRVKAAQQHQWPVNWRSANSMRELLKRIENNGP